MHAWWQAGVANNYEPNTSFYVKKNLRLKFSFAITTYSIYLPVILYSYLKNLFQKSNRCNKRRTVKVIE